MSTTNLSGQTLGQYELIEVMGSGGMGAVYRARQTNLERDVAVKILNLSLGNDQDYIARFNREAKTSAQLEHAHIVPVYDYGTQGSVSFVVMRLLTGGSLADRLAHRKETGQPLPSLTETAEILRQLASALDYAHSQGIIHRDIKPSNVMFDDHGTSFVVDFGIAKIATSNTGLTGSGMAIGTPSSMAPEQWRGEDITVAADQYSLGVIAYTMLTGQLPFYAETPFQLMHKHLNEAPLTLQAIRPELPQAMTDVIHKAMAKDPSDRYTSVGEFAEAFAEVAHQVKPETPTHFFSTLIKANESNADYATFKTAHQLENSVVSRISYSPRNVVLSGIVVASIAILTSLILNTAIEILDTRNISESLVIALFFISLIVFVSIVGRYLFNSRVKGKSSPQIRTKQDSVSGDSKAVQFQGTVISELPNEVPEQIDVVPINDELFMQTQLYDEQTSAKVRVTVIDAERVEYVGMSQSINQFPYIIGRQPSADMILNDRTLSGQHVSITMRDNTYYIRDLSRNGAALNGMRLPSNVDTLLMPGSKIMLSRNITLVFGFEQPPQMPDIAGQTIDNRYLLEELLHQGGKASVYRAHDKKFSKNVAIKLLSSSLTQYKNYTDQFEQDIKSVSKLNHPHIIKILDYGDFRNTEIGENSKYIVMPYLEGGTLETRLEEKIEPHIGIKWLVKIAEALDHVHRQNIIHSGIKPSSIVFDGDQNPYLTDFAVAQEIGQDGNRLLVGSPLFLAPEQWDDLDITPATDQYALAVLAYRLFTGEFPYKQMEIEQMREKNFANGCPPAHTFSDNISSSVSDVLNVALHRTVSKRYPSVIAFTDALNKATRIQVQDSTPAPPINEISQAKDVFISYRRQPSAMLAHLIYSQLEEQYSISAFVDTRALDGAKEFPDRLRDAVEKCSVFVCLLADTTLDSEWVLEEITTAMIYNKPMIPVFQESFAMPVDNEEPVSTLLKHDGVKILDRQSIFVDHSIADLAEMIRQTLP